MSALPELESLLISQEELRAWKAAPVDPAIRRLAQTLFRVLPRAKGFAPRMLGKVWPQDRLVCSRTRRGALIAVDMSALDTYCQWEQHIVDTLIAFTRPGDVVYDIGANVGYFSIEVSQMMQGQVEVHAFEPQPSLARHIAASASINGFERLHVHRTLVGTDEGVQKLFLGDYTVHASLVSRSGNESLYIECPTINLGRCYREGSIPGANVIKIDVEGAEMHVLLGAHEILQEMRPVIIFEADENVERFEHKKSDLFKLIEELGEYQFYKIAERGLARTDHHGNAVPRGDNFVAVPAEKVANFDIDALLVKPA